MSITDNDGLTVVVKSIIHKPGPDLWRKLISWGHDKDLLSPDDTGILETAASIPDKIPTEKQSERILVILKRLQDEGCQIGLEIG